MGARTKRIPADPRQSEEDWEIDGRLRVLRQLAGNRFLQGNLLNALQQTTVEDVQLIRLRVEQLYIVVEGTKSRTKRRHVLIPGRLPTATERIVVNSRALIPRPTPATR